MHKVFVNQIIKTQAGIYKLGLYYNRFVNRDRRQSGRGKRAFSSQKSHFVDIGSTKTDSMLILYRIISSYVQRNC